MTDSKKPPDRDIDEVMTLMGWVALDSGNPEAVKRWIKAFNLLEPPPKREDDGARI